MAYVKQTTDPAVHPWTGPTSVSPKGSIYCGPKKVAVAQDNEVAARIVLAVNSHDELVAALRELMSANDAVQTALCDGPDVPGFDRYALPKAQDRVTEAEREAAHVLSRISDVQIKGAA